SCNWPATSAGCFSQNIASPLALADICSVMLQKTMRGRHLRFLPAVVALAGSLAFVQAELPFRSEDCRPARPGRRPCDAATGLGAAPRLRLQAGFAFAAAAVATRWATRRHTALRAAGMGESTLMKKKQQKVREMEVGMLEGALTTLFKRMEEPDIFKVREILMRLAKTNPRPNQKLTGDWIIFWASREGCVDKLFGSGVTEEGWWLQMQEYLLRLSNKKQGRKVEAIEIVRKVGPFPNQSNSLKGTYAASGTNRLKIVFTEMKTDEGKDIEPRGGKDKMVVDVDVIYSSKNMIALQWEDANGECDFYVLTPVNSILEERDKYVGTSRARNFFN
ncbi:unnamed protein product, partial [Effrenium voratum]